MRGRRQSVYIIEDLVRGKQIKTHVNNLRPFLFNPAQVDPHTGKVGDRKSVENDKSDKNGAYF